MPARKQFKVGDRAGRWTAIKDGDYSSGEQWVLCRCDCGTIRSVSAGNLRQRENASCGCGRYETLSSRYRKPAKIGQRFGRLVVTGEPLYESRKRHTGGGYDSPSVPCMCDCGTPVFPKQACLRRGTTESCGCLHRERSSEAANRDIHKRANLDRRYEGMSGKLMMRSSWEVAVAHRLDRDGLTWKYEPETFKLSGNMRYTPDFMVDLGSLGILWIEVKGEFFGRSAEKIAGFRAAGHALYVVGKDNFKAYAGISPHQAHKKYPPVAA